MINKRMMLCAVVGGSIEEYNEMIEVHNLYAINCPHYGKHYQPWNNEDTTIKASIFTQYETLHLKAMHFNGEKVGAIAKCPTCGKIYCMIES